MSEPNPTIPALTAEEIAQRIIRAGWHETRATYSPTFIDYVKLADLIATAIQSERSLKKEAVSEAYEKPAETVSAEKTIGNLTRALLATRIQNLKDRDQ